MNHIKELIIDYNRKETKILFFVLPCIIAFMGFFLLFLTSALKISLNSNFIGFLILFLIKCFFCVIILALSIILITLIQLVHSTTPFAILNEDGIWVNHFGLINWNNIKTMEIYIPRGREAAPPIGIYLKNLAIVRKQADWKGRMGFFWSNILDGYHISIPVINQKISSYEIMQFAQLYLPSKKIEDSVKKESKQLIVDYHSNHKKNALFIIIGILGAFITMFLYAQVRVFTDYLIIGFFTVFLIKNLITLLRSPRPQAILESDGILIEHFGFIPWENIALMEVQSRAALHSAPIGINIKDIALLQQQADWIGSLKLSSARIFEKYHITIRNTAISGYDIVEFAEQYLKQEGRP